MKEKPFYMSKKFAYAVVMTLGALAVALLPAALELDAEQTETLNKMVPLIIGFGFALVGGHSVIDAISLAKGQQIPGILEALEQLRDAIENPREVAVNISSSEATPKAEQ